jgi:hypothetical protein
MKVTFRDHNGAGLSAYSGCLRTVYMTIVRTVQVTVVRTFRNLLHFFQLRRQSLIRYFTPGSEPGLGTHKWSRNTPMSPDRRDSRS